MTNGYNSCVAQEHPREHMRKLGCSPTHPQFVFDCIVPLSIQLAMTQPMGINGSYLDA